MKDFLSLVFENIQGKKGNGLEKIGILEIRLLILHLLLKKRFSVNDVLDFFNPFASANLEEITFNFLY